jgi:hypothetical protein
MWSRSVGLPLGVQVIAFLWGGTILYGECLIHFRAILSCQLKAGVDYGKISEEFSSNIEKNKIVIISDPQLVDSTYPLIRRFPILGSLTKYYSDKFCQRMFSLIDFTINASSVVFLGDLMDGGREISSEEWKKSYERFSTIFPHRETSWYYFAAGNHDIGYMISEKKLELLTRFEKLE